MNKNKIINTEQIPTEEKAPKLVAEDVDETTQMIEEAAYYIGLNRGRNSNEGDALNDWFEAEKAVKENLD
ncbi:MAG TPA: DUF2934 domain-containing protein [bacterium]